MTEMLVTSRGGKWVQASGGVPNYCAAGQHMTTGPVWKWYEHQADATATACVCDACARGESDVR